MQGSGAQITSQNGSPTVSEVLKKLDLSNNQPDPELLKPSKAPDRLVAQVPVQRRGIGPANRGGRA